MPIIDLMNISKSFKNDKKSEKKVLSNISLSFEKDTFNIIIGFNGVGKSTLLDIMNYIVHPDEGKVIRDESLKYSYMLNNRTLYESLTSYEHIKFFANFHKISKEKFEQEIDYYLKDFEMETLKHTKFKGLSSGERKRINFIASVINSPDVIITDEPLANLDIKQKIKMASALKRLKEQKKTIIVVTHDHSVFEEFYDKVIILSAHNQITQMSKKEVESKHGNLLNLAKEYIR